MGSLQLGRDAAKKGAFLWPGDGLIRFVWMAFRTKFCHGIFTKPYISFDHVIQISRTKPTTEVSRLKDKHFLEDRSVELAEYLISQKATVRSTAKKFGVSKSTVHKDITEPYSRRNGHQA